MPEQDLYFRVKVGLRHSDGAGILARRLEDPRAYTYVPDLWDWFVQKHPEGEIVGPDAAWLIARGAGWQGEEDKFCAALVAAGFLGVISEGFRVKGWRDWAGFHLEVRAKEAAKKRGQRAGRPGDIQGTSRGQVAENKATDPSCPGDPSQISSLGSSVSEGVQGEVVLRPITPLVTFLRETYPDIRDPWKQEAAWTKAYPGIDLLSEALKAHAWETSNPKNAKKHHASFLNRWFSNATPTPKAPEPPPLPSLDAKWLGTLPEDERSRASVAFAELAARVRYGAYPDALPRLMAEAVEHFKATWGSEARA